jgi:hypothetical protein
MMLGYLIVYDVSVYLVWAVLYVVFAALEPSNALYAVYTRVHANYVTHLFATIRMLTIWERNYARSTLMPYTTRLILVLAVVFDAFNVVSTHRALSRAVEWAWIMELVLAYAFLVASCFYFIGYPLAFQEWHPKRWATRASVRRETREERALQTQDILEFVTP